MANRDQEPAHQYGHEGRRLLEGQEGVGRGVKGQEGLGQEGRGQQGTGCPPGSLPLPIGYSVMAQPTVPPPASQQGGTQSPGK